jgi:hypothetical protein
MKQKTASALPQALPIIRKKGKNTACTNSESALVKPYLGNKVKMSARTILVSVVLSVVMASFDTNMTWNYYNITLVVAIMCFMIHLLSKFLVRAPIVSPTANRRINENPFTIKQPKPINKKSKNIYHPKTARTAGTTRSWLLLTITLLGFTCMIVHGKTANVEKTLIADDGNAQNFGNSVSLYDKAALIGASGSTAGQFSLAGLAYIFLATNYDQTWTKTATLSASDPVSEGYFGASVSLYGAWALIGASGVSNFRGKAYIFANNTLPNPHLWRVDGTYAPASLLQDGSFERCGRQVSGSDRRHLDNNTNTYATTATGEKAKERNEEEEERASSININLNLLQPISVSVRGSLVNAFGHV